MFIALQKAAHRCECRIQFVMAGWFPGGETDHVLYKGSSALCTGCTGTSRRQKPRGSSLLLGCGGCVSFACGQPSGNFWSRPVEAMAAGVPVVVSDWDGYRYTVSSGVEGFRIPTLAPAHSEQGEELALQHDHGLLSYQDYAGAVAQHVAVDTEAAAMAIAQLAEDPALRQRMGEAGRQTVRKCFDWPVVARLHNQLYGELAELRRAGDGRSGLEGQHPLRADPFRDFAPFATACLRPDTELLLAMPLPELQYRLNTLTSLDRFYEQLHATPTQLRRLLEQLNSEVAQPCSLARLLSAWPAEQHDSLRLSLTWLAKLGFIHWSHPSTAR